MADGSSQTIDHIKVEFSSNIGNLVKDFEKAASSVGLLTSEFNHVETSSKKATSVINDFNKTATTTSKATVSISAYIDRASTSFDHVGSSMSKAASELGKTKKATDDAADSWGILDSVVGLVAKGLSATAIITGITTVGKACYEASIEVDLLTAKFESLYSASGNATENLLAYASTASGVYGDRTVVGNISTAVNRAFGNTIGKNPEATDNYLKYTTQLVEEYQKQFGINGVQLVDNLAKLIDKWELDINNVPAILNQLKGVASQMNGADVGANLMSLVSVTASEYGLYKGAMNYSFDEVLQAALSLDKGFKGLAQGKDALDREYKSIDNIISSLDTYIEIEENKLESYTSKGNKDAAAKSAKLLEFYKSMRGKTSEEVLRELFSSDDYDFLAASTLGSNKRLADSVRNALVNKGDYADVVSDAYNSAPLKIVVTFGDEIALATDITTNTLKWETISKSVEESNARVDSLVSQMTDDQKSTFEQVSKLLSPESSIGFDAQRALKLREYLSENMGELPAGTVGTADPTQFVEELFANYITGTLSMSEVNEALAPLEISLEDISYYLSDPSVFRAEQDIGQYAAQRGGSEAITQTAVDDLIENLPPAVANSIRSYQEIDKTSADTFTTQISQALLDHDISLYYDLVDALTTALTNAGGVADTEPKEKEGFGGIWAAAAERFEMSDQAWEQSIYIDTFSGSIDVDSGTIQMEGGTINSDRGSGDGFDLLGMLGIGRASAADDVVFNPDWNPLGKSGLAGSGTQQAADEATFVPGWSGQDSVDNTTPLDKINTSVAGMKTSLDNMTSWLTNMSPVVTVNQYIYSPTADSYTIKNAATMAVNTSQAGSYKLRA